MNFHTEQSLKELHPQLKKILRALRQRRNFNVETYVTAKVNVLNDYMRRCKLKACVIAVSGGVDSAVTLALVDLAAKQPASPIATIVPIALPIFEPEFTTNQAGATDRGQELMEKLGMTRRVIDLTKPFLELKRAVDQGTGVIGQEWASGQLVSYIRTPSIYYVTSLLSQNKQPAIVCGTTNRDEGAYLGYFGKASDGMVDVQLISDLHKSEVRSVGRYLGIPQSILEVVPTGDMFDGRVDEEVFGAVYDFVELFLLLKSLENDLDRASYLTKLDPQAKEQYGILSRRLEDLHSYNGHKYKVGSPAYHLDVMEAGAPGGWPNGFEKVDTEPKGKEFFINPFNFASNIWHEFYANEAAPSVRPMPLPKGTGYELSGVLVEMERRELLQQAHRHGWKAVGLDGILAHYQEGDQIGSYRASAFSPELAQLVWKRISASILNLRIMADDTPTDWDDHRVWRAIGISPLFRFIRYTSGGLLVPHYDGPFTYASGQKTLMSLVIYLATDHVTGGNTRFINDPQIDTPLTQKDYADWQRFARDDEILFAINPEPGAAIAFDHRVLHDALAIAGEGEKVILRTDIVFTKCGLK